MDTINVPTVEQIRAARALIGWSQGELADQAGLSQTGIARIENGTNQPNSTTIGKITSAFDKADIEFIGDSGVKKRTGEVRTLKNVNGFRTFINSVYDVAKNEGGKICVFNSDHTNFYKWCGGEEWYKMHAKRMQAVSDNIDMRVIVAEQDNQFIGSSFAQYRWFPKDLWNDQTIYAYGDYLAFLNFLEDDVRVMILKQPKFTEGFRVLFDIAWNDVAQIPKKLKDN